MPKKKNPDAFPMEKITVLVNPFALDEAHEIGSKRGDKNISETVRKALDNYVLEDKIENRTSELEEQNKVLAEENRDILVENLYLQKQIELYERALSAYESNANEKKKLYCNQR